MLESLIDPKSDLKSKKQNFEIIDSIQMDNKNRNNYQQNQQQHQIQSNQNLLLSQTQTDLKEFMNLETNVKNSLNLDYVKIAREE